MVLADDPRCGDLNREDYALALDPAGVNNQHLHQAHQARELNEEGILSTLHELAQLETPSSILAISF